MRRFLSLSGVTTAAMALAAFAPSAVAQEIVVQWACQPIAAGLPEPLGDREGHAITISEFTCSATSGFMADAIANVMSVWERNGATGVQLSSTGLIGKPGSTMVFRGMGGTLEQTVVDDKLTGWTASGRDLTVLATGTWAPLLGRQATWTAK
jgi:hypothetical protein